MKPDDILDYDDSPTPAHNETPKEGFVIHLIEMIVATLISVIIVTPLLVLLCFDIDPLEMKKHWRSK